ncbi:formate dehydrogenase accessory sulfurtransferase FdhD [Microbulbifer aggregans]|uniref:formate dehydrogenase accessory sulfurtransferase FdhD n=1 Tax=Microbulbifer aggregans TaxID=1769779 RepID=UPI001CFD13C1|nr:formate dehydrogenase accessory sulfurtransferase FdhD [Microbulbifer aggregans]
MRKDTQALAVECAVALSFNGLNYAVMMATPENLEDFAVGFSLSAGIVSGAAQILDVEVTTGDEDSMLVDITLNQRALHELKQSRRNLAGTSGCGLCGMEALEQALAPLAVVSGQDTAALPPVSQLQDLRGRFQQAQQYRKRRGAMHAALFVDACGTTKLCREDIGRHNALDKLLGACVRSGFNLAEGFVALTSRCSLELVQKALRLKVGTLISLSSPSDISVRWAQKYQLNLLHQPAQGPARIYSPLPLLNPSELNPSR